MVGVGMTWVGFEYLAIQASGFGKSTGLMVANRFGEFAVVFRCHGRVLTGPARPNNVVGY